MEASATGGERIHLRQNKGDRSLLNTMQVSWGGVWWGMVRTTKKEAETDSNMAVVGVVFKGGGEEVWDLMEFSFLGPYVWLLNSPLVS